MRDMMRHSPALPRRVAAPLLALLAVLPLVTQAASAQSLVIATSSPPTSIDPHFHNLMPNNALAAHVFDRLVHQDARQNLMPGLALSWNPVSDTVWDIVLRPGVRFHDGQPFTSADVEASLARAPNVANSPGSFAQFLRGIQSVEVTGDHTLRITTRTPNPLLPNDLSLIDIVETRFREAPGDAFRTGTAMIGTGPFRFGEYIPGQQAVLARNPDYWGGAVPWEKVTLRIIPDDSARVAALAAGDVDMVEAVPSSQRAGLEARPGFKLWSTVSNRLVFLSFDTEREVSPFVAGMDGKPLAANPLRDARVRRAISLSVDRAALADRLMEGSALPAGAVLAPGFFGVSDSMQPERPDPATVKTLLAEAGYSQGFRLTLHGSNNRFPNDDKVLQAVAQMLTRNGIAARVETMPFSMLLSQGGAPAYAYSAMLLSFGANTGEASSSLRSLVATGDRATGMGAANRGRYSNPAFDALLRQAVGTVAPEARRELLEQAGEMAMQDHAIVPLLFQVNLWATRNGLEYQPRADEWTLAQFVTPRK
jgi:peptide/nickel transport system substrate-binding protein